MDWIKKRFNKLTNEQIEELNGKWTAWIKNKTTGDWEMIRRTNGLILTDEELINVQVETEELHPEIIDKNQCGRLVTYCHIHKRLLLK